MKTDDDRLEEKYNGVANKVVKPFNTNEPFIMIRQTVKEGSVEVMYNSYYFINATMPETYRSHFPLLFKADQQNQRARFTSFYNMTLLRNRKNVAKAQSTVVSQVKEKMECELFHSQQNGAIPSNKLSFAVRTVLFIK